MADGLINKGTVFEMCVTPQPADLTQIQFAALTYVPVCCVTEVPPVGSESEIVSAFCIDGTEKVAVGASTGAELEVSAMYEADCIGQDTIRVAAMAESSTSYAFRVVRPDGRPAPAGQTPTTIYFRAMMTGYTFGGDDVNAMIADTYNLKITQKPFFIKPTPIT